MMQKFILILLFGLICFTFAVAQDYSLTEVHYTIEGPLQITAFTLIPDMEMKPAVTMPLFSLRINDSLIYSSQRDIKRAKGEDMMRFPFGLTVTVLEEAFTPGWKCRILFENRSRDTVKLADVVPFGEFPDRIHITASGPWSLARTKLFRPGLGPVGVVLPDNAWEMGYGVFQGDEGVHLCAITRRTEVTDGEKRRWWTRLPPGGKVEYVMYADAYTGPWQNGLRLMFQQRYLYDLKNFDNRLYRRPDLAWIRRAYVMSAQMAWDHEFYDARKGGYQFSDFLKMGRNYFGGWDIYVLWPTWPTLGLDQRNQWDLYADLPGGLEKLREITDTFRQKGTRFFVSYNPWDQSTREVDPYQGMADLIRATDADGVILDTYGWSTEELQAAADSIKPGIVMYSEGMAVPKDMPGIITGRVHDAIYMPPPLNLIKFIKPDNAIFRVCQLHDGHMHREVSVAFFNGYGIEINSFRPGRPSWLEEQYRYVGKLVRILRQNSSAFYSQNWTPLIPTLRDSILVNEWPAEDKTLYTIFSLIPEGCKGPLFKSKPGSEYHYVSLYHHEEIAPDTVNGDVYITARAAAFNRNKLHTREEGAVDCIARLPVRLQVELKMDSLWIDAPMGQEILVWAGEPSYQSKPASYPAGSHVIKLLDTFGRHEGKFVVQLMGKEELLDERIINLQMQIPRIISKVKRTKLYEEPPEQMLKIPGAENYIFQNEGAAGIIPYPHFYAGDTFKVNAFFMDKYPVTNAKFKEFIDQSGYQPDDTVNYLKEWKNGVYPDQERNHPVVYISYEDARAYADWAGKRLPTEIEWQYAAEGLKDRLWPWGNAFDSTLCNVNLENTTPVDKYPDGATPEGVMDLVGNVWQLTNDLYDNSSYYFVIIRGGSYYHPTSSWWYVKGGPQPLNKSQMLLRVEQGFERNATVGFRCVADAAE